MQRFSAGLAILTTSILFVACGGGSTTPSPAGGSHAAVPAGCSYGCPSPTPRPTAEPSGSPSAKPSASPTPAAHGLYVANAGDGDLTSYLFTGSQTTPTIAGLSGPWGLAVDTHGK